MRRRLLIVLGVLIALGLCWQFVAAPMIDAEAMKIPVVNALTAIRRGDAKALRGNFTPRATAGVADRNMDIDTAIRNAEPFLEQAAGTSMRFGEFTTLQRKGNVVEADVTVWVYIEGGDDLPYRHVPLQRRGHVRLIKQGWFTWKIDHVRSDASEFERYVE